MGVKLEMNTYAHPFTGPLSRTTQVSRYQKGKTNLDFTEARVAVASAGPYASLHLSLQKDNYTSTRPLSFYRPDTLPATQPTAKNWK